MVQELWQEHLVKLETPILFINASLDTVTCPLAIEEAFEMAPATDKTLVEVK